MAVGEARVQHASRKLAAERSEWVQRVFGVEAAQLVACDAEQRFTWTRGKRFKFLYRSERGTYYLMESEREWRTLTEDEAHELANRLPVRMPEP